MSESNNANTIVYIHKEYTSSKSSSINLGGLVDHGGQSLGSNELIQNDISSEDIIHGTNNRSVEALFHSQSETGTRQTMSEGVTFIQHNDFVHEVPNTANKRLNKEYTNISNKHRLSSHTPTFQKSKGYKRFGKSGDGEGLNAYVKPNGRNIQRYIHYDDLDLTLKGYNDSVQRKVYFFLFVILTCGLGFFTAKWSPKLKLFFTAVSAPLSEASLVLVREKKINTSIVRVKQIDLDLPARSLFPINLRTKSMYDVISGGDEKVMNSLMARRIRNVKYFKYQKIRFIYNSILNEYDSIEYWSDPRWSLGINHEKDVSKNSIDVDHTGVLGGINSVMAAKLLKLFGPNSTTIEVPPIRSLIWDQVCSFFSVFQVFSLILWSLDEYFQYALCVLFLMIITITHQVYSVRKSLVRTRDMAKFSCLLKVFRNNSWITLNSMDLVPGDLYQLSGNSDIIPCDSLLLTGSCTVNENVLTGESIPLLKSPATSDSLEALDPWSESLFKIETRCSRSTLYTGSWIVRSRCGNSPKFSGVPGSEVTAPLALVLRTGFNTMKGSLIRLVLYPKPNRFKYDVDAYKFIAVLFLISLSGLIYSLIVLYPLEDSTFGFLFVRTMDIFTVVVPPALPATLSVGIGFALAFLMKRGVSCFSPPKVPVAGKTDTVIFDKTGTITEPVLSVYGVHPCHNVEGSKKMGGKLHVRFIQCDLKGADGSVLSSCSSSVLGKDSDPLLIDEIYFHGSVPDSPSLISKNIFTSYDFPNTRKTDEKLSSCEFDYFFSQASQLYYSYPVDVKDRDPKFLYAPMKTLLSFNKNHKRLDVDNYKLAPTTATLDNKSLLYLSSNRALPLLYCISSCHSIVKIDTELTGDFMDVEMFNFTKWEIHELSSIEYNAYKGFQTTGCYDPNVLSLNETSVTASSDYDVTLKLLFMKGATPTLSVSPYLIQIVNVRESETEHANIENDTFSSTSIQGNDVNIFRDSDICVDNLWAVLSRVELLTVRVFEFSSESRHMSVITKMSTIGKCIPLAEYLSGVSVSTNDKYKCLEVDPSVIYESARVPEGLERIMESRFEVYTKGAPENVRSFCIPSSIPSDFESKLAYYSYSGYRVIACAYKQLDDIPLSKIFEMSQEQLEKDLTFAGFIVFENKLKCSSRDVCSSLKSSKIGQYVCSGDNLLTSINVARKCGIIGTDSAVFIPHLSEKSIDGVKRKKVTWDEIDDSTLKLNPTTLVPSLDIKDKSLVVPTFNADIVEHTLDNPLGQHISVKTLSAHGNHAGKSFMSGKHSVHKSYEQLLDNYCLAMTGDVFQWLQENATKDMIGRILTKTSVYARMLPYQKLSLVEEHQALGHTVLFVGDGANDIAALRTADAGLSLSGNESSIAAPFISTDGDPSKALQVICCGRSALVTSFCCFKYMALYSLVQFVAVLILYTDHMNISDPQLLIIDIGLTLPLAMALSVSRPSNTIHSKPPSSNLVSVPVLTDLIGQILIQLLTQLSLYLYLKQQPWYKTETNQVWLKSPTPVQFAIFSSSMFIYLANSFVCCAGLPYREEVWKNYKFSAIFFVILIACILTNIYSDSEAFAKALNTVPLPTESKFPVIIASLIGFVFSVMYNMLILKSLSSAISSYLERSSILLLIYADTHETDRIGFWPSLSLFFNKLKIVIMALFTSSIGADEEIFLRAKSQYNRKNNKSYLVYEELMRKDIERVKFLLS